MSLLSIFKTKKPKTMDLPPPPLAVEPEHLDDLPEIQAPPAPMPELPVAPAPLEHDFEFPAPVEEEVEIELPHDQAPAPQEMRMIPERESIAPLFVSTNDYQTILNGIGEIRKTLGNSENILAHLTELKNKEERVFSEWKTQMQDIERKMSYVDAVIAKSQQALG